MNRRKSYALIVSIYTIVVFSTVGLTIASFIAGEAITNSMSLSGLKAFHVAEAGLEYLMKKGIPPDPVFVNGKAVIYSGIPFAGGEFDLELTDWGGGNYTARCIAYVNRNNFFNQVKREIQVGLKATSAPSCLLYAVYSGGRTDIWVNSGKITGGDLMAGKGIHCSLQGTYNTYENEDVAMPVINWDSYKALAVSAGNYYAGDLSFPNNSSGNGVYYVEGNIYLRSNVTITGTLVCKGNIIMSISEGITITPASGYPAILTDGRIGANLIQNSTFNGLVCSGGHVNFNVINNVTFNGGIIAEDKINMIVGSKTNINYNPAIQDTPFIEGSGGGLKVTSWINI